MISRQVELAELLEAFIVEHAVILRRVDEEGEPYRSVSLLVDGGPVDLPPIAGGRRSLARPAELFLEALRRHDFTLTDDYLPKD